MAFTNIQPHVGVDFRALSSRWEGVGTRVTFDGPDGGYHGYQNGGAIVSESLVTPNAAWLSASATQRAATDSAQTALQTFMNRCEVLKDKAKAGTLTAGEIQESIAKLFRIAAALT